MLRCPASVPEAERPRKLACGARRVLDQVDDEQRRCRAEPDAQAQRAVSRAVQLPLVVLLQVLLEPWPGRCVCPVPG